MTAGTRAYEEKKGLFGSHAYGLLGAKEVKDCDGNPC